MQYVLLGRALLDGKILIPKGGDVSSVAGLRLGLVLVFNHCVWRCRIRLEASTQSLQDPPESLADEILSDCINRVLVASPTALTTATLPNNTFPPPVLARASAKPRSFGASGTRSGAQAQAARRHAAVMVEGLPANAIQIWTDGGAAPNPGPAGAGALVILPDGRRFEHSFFLGHSTNNEGELWALGGALEVCLQHAQPTSSVHHFSDSALTLQLLEGRGFSTKLHYLVRACRALRERLPCTTTHHHVCAHVGIPGNEEADHLATLGIEFSQRLGNFPLDLRAIVACEGFHGTSC